MSRPLRDTRFLTKCSRDLVWFFQSSEIFLHVCSHTKKNKQSSKLKLTKTLWRIQKASIFFFPGETLHWPNDFAQVSLCCHVIYYVYFIKQTNCLGRKLFFFSHFCSTQKCHKVAATCSIWNNLILLFRKSKQKTIKDKVVCGC